MSKNVDLKNKAQGFSALKRREAGFSLLEVALALLVIGTIIAPIMAMYKAEMYGDRIANTRGKLAKIENAINQYFKAGNASYPCPASLTVGEGDPTHGEEGALCDDVMNMKLCTDNAWRADGDDGYCVTSTNPATAVVIGAVPFASLQLNQLDTIDSWGNKILYAVTQQQTVTAQFDVNDGAITARAYSSNVADSIITLTPSSDPDFFLLSHGETGVGAYTKEGNLISACGTDADSNDYRNCDYDNEFLSDVNTLGRINAAAGISTNARHLTPGARYYDDITRFQTSVPEGIWFPHKDFTDHIMTLSTRVGVGTSSPEESLDVVGNLRAEGNIKSDAMCNASNDCFDPELIVGTRAEMLCNEGGSDYKGVANLSNNRLSCITAMMGDGGGGTIPVDANGEPFVLPIGPSANEYSTVDCLATGELISGFTPSGDAICSPMP